ncbi:MAG: AAA family ATPase [Candidatus Eremiobacteraeota bacterium]|nr:AAA family ATPase [Candidatus Eremiobacteraeota bacterium]MCW5872262.1 AAA family ATPase [Candidatus Eremiobacteraeota bacterium]
MRLDPKTLLRPEAYRHPVGHLELLETHISWVILTGEWAYKLKKPVNFGFLDYSSLERRRTFCQEELRLNRRLAPDVYREVVSLNAQAGELCFEGPGEVLEYAVKMRQFPQAGLYDRQLSEGRLVPAQMEQLGRLVADFHQQAARSEADSEFGRPDQVLSPCLDNFTTLYQLEPEHRPVLEALVHWTEMEFKRLKPHFSARKRDGFIRELHGDLHLGNVAEIEGRPVPFDGIEFDPELRWVDTMNDLAFLVSDLEHRERPDLGRIARDAYLEETVDYDGLALWDFYVLYRWMVRAKVVALKKAQGHPEVAGEIRLYLSQALARTRPRPVRLVVMHGLSGSGKTHYSQALLQREDIIRLRSDVIRKSLHGLSPSGHSGSGLGQGIYADEQGQRTYRALAEKARRILEDGHSVVVDATCLKRAQRDLFRNLAAELEVPFEIVSMEAELEVLQKRIQFRQKQAKDPSEADLSVLEHQTQTQELIGADER